MRNRLVVFGVAAFLCVGLMAISLIGLLRPAESIATVPLALAQQAISSITQRVSEFFSTLSDFQTLRQRNADLERALINFQAEIVDLREVKSDYERLAGLMRYRDANADQQVLAATVVGREVTGMQRWIMIGVGTRDGIQVGMPVVTELGLVGRVSRVGATNAQVQLLNDTTSFVTARLQLTRAEGTIQGTSAGSLHMIYIPLGQRVQDGDSVVTSGIGGRFPRGILIGQVTSSRLDDSKLFQEAQVRSLIDFSQLEMVLVITNFEPLDMSAFATATPAAGAPPGQ